MTEPELIKTPWDERIAELEEQKDLAYSAIGFKGFQMEMELAQALSYLAEGYRQGYAKGYRQGYAKGYEAGNKSGFEDGVYQGGDTSGE